MIRVYPLYTICYKIEDKMGYIATDEQSLPLMVV
jgi:hypothetical protein